MRDAEFFKKQAGGVLCLLCPNHCLIDEGGVGRCLGRGVQEGSMRLRNYARVVAASVDPVEKKPLYHLFPGQPVYSIGSYGCNLRCRFCQNADISQHQQPSEEIMPAQLVSEAVSI